MRQDPATASEPAPGHGATILTLGILSIVLAGCSPAGLVRGWLAVSKGRADLPDIDRGLILEDERGLTKAGKICGTVGLCLSGAMFLLQLLQLAVFVFMLVVVGAAAAP